MKYTANTKMVYAKDDGWYLVTGGARSGFKFTEQKIFEAGALTCEKEYLVTIGSRGIYAVNI